MGREIGIHMFQWNLKDIKNNLGLIKECGYTFIQISPIQGVKDDNSRDFWQLYQPLGMNIYDSYIGSKKDLIELCEEANKLNLKIIADVVLRHVATDDYDCKKINNKVDDELKNVPYYFTHSIECRDIQNRWCETNESFGLPMLNYNNAKLQYIYKRFLNELKSCGIGGFRVDMGKHFALPDEGSDFWEEVFGDFKDMFNYAECIDCNRDILDKYTKFINVLSNCNCTDISKQVSFIMTHDTEYTWKSTSGKTDEVIANEWEYILNNNREMNLLFYCRPFNDLWCSSKIKDLNIKYK